MKKNNILIKIFNKNNKMLKEELILYICASIWIGFLLLHIYLDLIINNCLLGVQTIIVSQIRFINHIGILLLPLDYLTRQILYYYTDLICESLNWIYLILIVLKFIIFIPALFIAYILIFVR